MRNVLVVDDDPSIRNLLAEELRYLGYSVITARNGSEALDRLSVMTPDVIVLDLMMPVMDGWTFVERYRDPARRRSVPIIAVSAEGDLCPGYEALGVTAFLRKPFDLNELADCIAQLTLARKGSGAFLSPDTAANDVTHASLGLSLRRGKPPPRDGRSAARTFVDRRDANQAMAARGSGRGSGRTVEMGRTERMESLNDAVKPMLGPMPKPPISPAWLSAEMARALAASCPPLKTADVVNVAHSLTAHAKPTRVIGQLLLHGAELLSARRVVEALRALRDLAA